MKFTWCNNISNLAAWNSAQIEEVNMDGEYQELLEADQGTDEFDIHTFSNRFSLLLVYYSPIIYKTNEYFIELA
jgi:hypothetical protein